MFWCKPFATLLLKLDEIMPFFKLNFETPIVVIEGYCLEESHIELLDSLILCGSAKQTKILGFEQNIYPTVDGFTRNLSKRFH